MVKIQIVCLLAVLIGATVGLPLKEREIDELIYRLQELKHQNGLANHHKNGLSEALGAKQLPKKVNDSDLNRLVYDYYATGFAPVNDDIHHNNNQKRFDEIERSSGFNKFGFGNNFAKREFDEIDRNGFDNFYKRHFDEIDRIGFHGY